MKSDELQLATAAAVAPGTLSLFVMIICKARLLLKGHETPALVTQSGLSACLCPECTQQPVACRRRTAASLFGIFGKDSMALPV